MVKASARVFVLSIGLSGSVMAAELQNDAASQGLGQPGAQPTPPPAAAVAAPPPQADRATTLAGEKGIPKEEPKLPWHDTWLIVDNSVTTQTLGVGGSYQSSNPTYYLSLSLRPRIYFYDSKKEAFYASGRFDITREFTNSDTTTAQGETIVSGAPHGLGASDPTLFTVYRRRLAKRGDYETTVSAFAPIVTLPLSKFSLENGTYLGLGTQVWVYHDVPLAGSRASLFRKMTFGGIAGYNHTFTRATTPTNPELRRVRLDPEGRTIPGDQLTGAAFPEHELRTALRLIVEVAGDFSWWTDFTYNPTWLYGFSDVNVCTLTNCVQAARPENVSTFVTVTGFSTSLYYHLMNELTIGAGYSNATVQPGPDGQRRNVFYGPGALFSLSIIGHLDEMYLTAAGRRSTESSLSR